MKFPKGQFERRAYSVSQKIIPCGFLTFSQTVGNF